MAYSGGLIIDPMMASGKTASSMALVSRRLGRTNTARASGRMVVELAGLMRWTMMVMQLQAGAGIQRCSLLSRPRKRDLSDGADAVTVTDDGCY
mmetsp:Transcript_66384/g.130811  ORF Transcript_66384/g.130811 Transcript_66384/m.130811 type:complete len:94 (-) Transcript_66384:127-408(-)